MRRVLSFLNWEAELWDQRASSRTFEKPEDTEAFAAYAKHQAAIRWSLKASFAANWADVGNMATLGVGIASDVMEADMLEVPTIDTPPREHLDEDRDEVLLDI